MTALYHLNENIAHLLEGFLESAVPLIAGLAEVIGLFIIAAVSFDGFTSAKRKEK